MGFLIREGARLVVRLPQEVDHHKTESIRIQVDQMIRKEPVTEVEFDFSRTMFMDSAGIGLLIGRSQMMEALGGKVIISIQYSEVSDFKKGGETLLNRLFR